MRKHSLPAAVILETYPVDPDFPELEIAADAGRMLDVFRTHLKPVGGKAYHIETCVPFRFRCRQSGARCVLQYTLRVVDPGTGRRWDQWVTGLLYAEAGKAERLWREMLAGDPRQQVPAGWLTFEPVDFIPDLQMAVQVFPYDRRLPDLARVMDGALGALEPLLLARLGPGLWGEHGEPTIEPTRYRTELGAALRYTLQAREPGTGRTATLRCYLKVYRNDHGEETFRLLRSLSRRAGEAERPYDVVRPIAYLGALRTLVLEEAAGVSLEQALLQGCDAPRAVRAVARAAAAFNQDDLGIVPPHSLAEQLDDVKRAGSLVRWACPRARAEVDAITAALVTGLEAVRPAPIHRDLKPDHVFVSGDHVIFIDLDAVALGDPVRDPAHLFAHIVAGVGLDSLPREQARTAAAGFVDEYFAHVPEPWRRQFPLHCAGALVEVAGGIFKRQEPRWPEKVAAAVAEASRVLASHAVTG